jgi:hypothetical protein
MKTRQRGGRPEPSHRADRNFAVATVALMIFFLVGGFSAWMFGSLGAAVSPVAPHSEIPNSTR